MQTARIVQVVILLILVALAATSCSTAKEYTSKIFPARNVEMKDTTAVAKSPRFLDMGDADKTEEQGWVTTDIIMGRDSAVAAASTESLDELAKEIPAVSDSATLAVKKEMVPVVTQTQKATTTKKKKKETPKAVPAPQDQETVKMENKPEATEEPAVVKTSRPGEVRTKRTRQQ